MFDEGNVCKSQKQQNECREGKPIFIDEDEEMLKELVCDSN